MNVDKFLDGQRACKAGKPCEVDSDKDFIRGYSAQYDLEQALEYNSEERHPDIKDVAEDKLRVDL